MTPAQRKARQLARLADLARLKADRDIARLAATGRTRAALQGALAALGRAEPPLALPPDPAPPDAATLARPAPDPAAAVAPPAPAAWSESPVTIRARLAHGAWILARRTELNARLALIEADWQRLRPPAARAFGRAEALREMAVQARAAARPRSAPP